MPKDREVTLINIVGTINVSDGKGEPRPAKEREAIKADDIVTATKRSSCDVRAGAVVIAAITNAAGGKGGTKVTTFHPLVRSTGKAAGKLKAQVVKVGNLLVLKAPRQFKDGIGYYHLKVDLA